MNYPPSLSVAVLERSHRCSNGELGIVQDDVAAFLDSCERDGVDVLGWELWLVEALDDVEVKGNQSGARVWGTVPPWAQKGGDLPMIYGGSGDLRRTRSQIASLRLADEILPQRLGQIRFNFTLAG